MLSIERQMLFVHEPIIRSGSRISRVRKLFFDEHSSLNFRSTRRGHDMPLRINTGHHAV